MDDPSLLEWSGPFAYVADMTDPTLSSEDRHHLHRVLRLRAGAALALGDGRGSWVEAVFDERSTSGAELTSPVRLVTKPEPVLSVSVALPKGERADWLIQKVTEIGIDEIVVLVAERSVVRWPAAKVDKGLERLNRIARSAGSQSRRAWLPIIRGPLAVCDAAATAASMLATPGGGPISPDCRNVLIGPEGGWTPAEIAAGPPTVGLGPQVLRVETAALVASTLLVALRSRLVLPARFLPENALGG